MNPNLGDCSQKFMSKTTWDTAATEPWSHVHVHESKVTISFAYETEMKQKPTL